MPLVSSSIPNLVNGVSQQPPTLRLASQAEVQENGLSTVSSGLTKRPPLEHISRISDSIPGNAYLHTINRDSNERYLVIISGGDLKVYDLAGNPQVVNFPDGKSYLATLDPSSSFRAVTVADYTFLANKTVEVKASTTTTPARPFEALVNVISGNYAKTYSVSINGTVAGTYTTPDGSDAVHASYISTDYIASALVAGLTAAGVTVTVYGSVLYLTKSTDFTISCLDGFNGAAMKVIKDRAQRFSDLPAAAGQEGYTVEVIGEVASSQDDYWVRFDKSTGTGVWRETAKPGISVGVDPSTMPWGLIREADGTFSFKKLSWTNRLVGDDDSAPHPSFVGRKIKDILLYRNRLGLIADENVILSEAGEFFNFYPTTVTDLLDSERIDVAVSHTKVSNLNYAVPFNKQLLLFSSQTQFALEDGDILTPRTVAIKPATEFECSPGVAPVTSGRNIYFVIPSGDFEGVREFYTVDNVDTYDATDVTSHVPKYIPTGTFRLSSASNENILCALTSAERNAIYVYKYLWNNNEKLQSSWSKWVLPSTDSVLSVEFIQSTLYAVINRPSGLYLESVNVATSVPADNEPYTVHLDRKLTVPKSALSYSAPYTTIDLAAFSGAPDDGEYVAVVATGQAKEAGTLAVVIWDGTEAKLRGDFTGCDLIVGRRYTLKYQLSTLMVRAEQGGVSRADTTARLQLRNLQVNFSETGYFKAIVTPRGRDSYTYVFTGKVLGVDSATIGQVGIETGFFRVPIQSQNIGVDIELQSDSPLPVSFLSADWEGYYVRRNQAV